MRSFKGETERQMRDMAREDAILAAQAPTKACGNCGFQHVALPAGGKDSDHGYYFQCEGGCNSTMFVPSHKLTTYQKVTK